MKTTLKTKLLQHILNKKKDEGFTLIELLVVIIIIGILAAIALPSFLNQASRARETEAQTNLGAVNRGQQAFLLEYGEFAHSNSGEDIDNDGTEETGLEALDVGIGQLEGDGSVITDYYQYTVSSNGPAAVAKADADPAGTPDPDLVIAAMQGCVNTAGETEIAKAERGDGSTASVVPTCTLEAP